MYDKIDESIKRLIAYQPYINHSDAETGGLCALMYFDDFFKKWDVDRCENCNIAINDLTNNEPNSKSVYIDSGDVYILCHKCDNLLYQDKLTIGMKSGCFALITAAHIKVFKFMKEHCDFLALFINDDVYLKKKKGGAIVPAEERKLILESIKYIDQVTIYSGRNEEKAIEKYIKEDSILIEHHNSKTTLFHSPEFIKRKVIPGKDIVDKIVYTPFYDEFSSTSDIIERLK